MIWLCLRLILESTVRPLVLASSGFLLSAAMEGGVNVIPAPAFGELTLVVDSCASTSPQKWLVSDLAPLAGLILEHAGKTQEFACSGAIPPAALEGSGTPSLIIMLPCWDLGFD